LHAISKSPFFITCLIIEKIQIIRSEWQIAMIEVFENSLWEERLRPGETRAVTQADESSAALGGLNQDE
jgi:hypothetical protein